MSEKILKKRLRDSFNVPYGMVIALNKNQFGYSICNTKAGDKYDDKKAFLIASSRARSHVETDTAFWIKNRIRKINEKPITEGSCLIDTESCIETCLHSCTGVCDSREIRALKELKKMEERAKRYFK